MTAALDRVIDIALGQALALEHGWGNEAADPGVCASTGGALRRAVASLGAEIRWPIPEPPEGADQPAADATAPETEGAETAPEPTYMELMREALVERCNKNPWCAREGEHGGECAFFASAPHPTARAQILAEVAASAEPEKYADTRQVGMIVGKALALVRTTDEEDGVEVYSRQRLVRAAALLVLGVERCDVFDAKRLDGAR